MLEYLLDRVRSARAVIAAATENRRILANGRNLEVFPVTRGVSASKVTAAFEAGELRFVADLAHLNEAKNIVGS